MAEFCSILLWAGAAIWGVLLIVGLINACLIRDIARINAPEPREWPFVSFIVPARNEEAGIAASARVGMLRLSPHAGNDEEEAERVLGVLSRA